jgi:hypothetical protein
MPNSPQQHERRRTPRVEVSERVHGTFEPPVQDVIVRDLSLGGFLVESPSAFPVDAVHHFRIAMKDGEWATHLTARTVHCRERATSGGRPSYLTGFAFVEPQGADAQRRLRELMNKATSVARF